MARKQAQQVEEKFICPECLATILEVVTPFRQKCTHCKYEVLTNLENHPLSEEARKRCDWLPLEALERGQQEPIDLYVESTSEAEIGAIEQQVLALGGTIDAKMPFLDKIWTLYFKLSPMQIPQLLHRNEQSTLWYPEKLVLID